MKTLITKTMNKIIKSLFVAAIAFSFIGCEVHEIWGDGRPDLEHVYLFYLDQPDNQTDYLSYEVAQNGDAKWRYGISASSGTWENYDTKWEVSIPFMFESERVRSYDAKSYVWIESTLTAGTDYVVTKEDGTTISPEANGGYPFFWPQAKKGKQKLKIKRLQGSSNGTIRVQAFNPSNDTPAASDVSTLVNNKTADYEVRCTSLDVNKVLITFN